MTDRGRYHLRGLVQSVRLQFGSTDPLTSDWAPLKDGPTLTFDREGREEGRQHSDAPMLSTVDERGLRTTVGSQAPFLPRQAAMEYGISVAAAVKFDVLTHYDPHDRPTEIVYRDPEQKALHRILLTYDDYGRIVREQVLMGDVFGGDEYSCVDSAAGNQRLTAEQREEVAAMFRAALPDGVFLTREYAYDDQGRLAQLLARMGGLSETRTSYTYDAHDNILEEHSEQSHRDGDVDGEGALITWNEASDESWNRYEYRYDDRGNFVERVVLRRVTPDRDFHRSNIERRTISYFD